MWGGERQDGAGLKSLNPSPPRPMVRGKNLVPSLPHHFCGAGKTCDVQSGEGQVK